MSDEPWPTIDGRPAKPSELAEFYVDMGVRAAKRETQDEIARLTKANAELREALQQVEASMTAHNLDRDRDMRDHKTFCGFDFGDGYGGSLDIVRKAIANSSEGE